MNQPSPVLLTVSQAIVRYLSAQYSSRDGRLTRLIPGFLGIFGHGNTGGIGQALDEFRRDMFFVEGRNEQGMAHAAAAFAKEKRREATLACTTSIGPGSTNLITAAAGAYINRLPLLLIPSDAYASRYQGTVLQGLENPAAADLSVNDCFRPIARFFDRITRPEQLLDSLPKAMRTLTDPVDSGPVVLSLPQDVQVQAYSYPSHFFERREWLISRPRADDDVLRVAAERINAAKRPIIVAGGGILYSRAESELVQMAEAAGIPVVETLAGKGAMPSANPMNLGGLGVAGTTVANAVARRADLIVCAGTRLSDFVTGSQSVFQHPEVRFLALNVNSADANKYGAFPVVGDLRQSLGYLIPLMSARARSDRAKYLSEIAVLGDKWQGLRAAALAAEPSPPLRQTEVIGLLNEFVEPGDTIITSAGTLPGDIFRYWETGNDKKCHIEFGYSCMGYDIAGAIGVKLARPEREVYAVLGDATFILSPADMAVAVQHRLKITVIVCDNQGMQSIRGLERRLVAHPYANLFEFRNPVSYESDGPVEFDIASIGKGLGALVYSVATRDEFHSALSASRKESRPCLIVINSDNSRVPPRDEVWWDIAPAEASEIAGVAQLRATYQDRRKEQRFHY